MLSVRKDTVGTPAAAPCRPSGSQDGADPAYRADMGYELVRVMLSGNQRKTLQNMVERADRGAMTVEHCAEVSRTVSALLDVEDPIRQAYTLEVSSPGIDRPLVRLADFARFAGHVAQIELHALRNGRRRFKGRIVDVEGDAVRLALDDTADDGEPVVLPHAEIARAKLVLTDALLAAHGA